MAPKSEFITRSELVLIATIAIAAVGGGFAWMHSDIGQVHDDITTVNKSVMHVGDGLSDLKEQVGTTNGKLDILIEEIRDQGKSPVSHGKR